MRYCKKAREATKARAVIVLLAAGYDRWQNNDFTVDSILRKTYDMGKTWLKEDETARNDFATDLVCRLRNWLGY